MKKYISSKTESHAGRIVLHLLCLMRDHKWTWHFAGIKREITI